MNLTHLLLNHPATIGLAKRLASSFYNHHGGFILAYHQIDLNLFKQHLEILKHVDVVPLTELVNRKKNGQSTNGLMAITVDDCYESTLPQLCDYCEQSQTPITFFAPIEFISGKPMPSSLLKNIIQHIPNQIIKIDEHEIDFTDKTEVIKLRDRLHHSIYYQKESAYSHELQDIIYQLIEKKVASEKDLFDYDKPVSWDFIAMKSKNKLLSFQSHSVTHQPVVALSSDELNHECLASKKFLQEVTNQEMQHFCYPYGGLKNIGYQAQKIIANYYTSAVTMERGRLNSSNDLFMLPRIPLYNIDTPSRTLIKILTK